MGVDVRRGGKIRMPQPVLNLLEGYAVGKQERCAAMPEIVEAHLFHAVPLDECGELRGQVIGLHPLAQLIYEKLLLLRLKMRLLLNEAAQDILRFSEEIDIHPSIVLGRLQNEGILSFDRYRELKENYYFVS